ncbi:MAG: hypothetical protein J6B52_03370 [Clostridia bacterium]|nr:hypothetical protein [Clostridia bacterium]
MYFNKASPPLNSTVQWRFCLRRPLFFDFKKNFLYNILEGRTTSDNSFQRKFTSKRRDKMSPKKDKKIDLRLTEKEKEAIQE